MLRPVRDWASTAQGGTVDLPRMGRRALVGRFIIAHTATAILNVFDQYAGSTSGFLFQISGRGGLYRTGQGMARDALTTFHE